MPNKQTSVSRRRVPVEFRSISQAGRGVAKKAGRARHPGMRNGRGGGQREGKK